MTAVLIIAVSWKAEAADYYNLRAIPPDEICNELGRINEAYPAHRKLGADGGALRPSRNQSLSGADLNLLRDDRMELVALLAPRSGKAPVRAVSSSTPIPAWMMPSPCFWRCGPRN